MMTPSSGLATGSMADVAKELDVPWSIIRRMINTPPSMYAAAAARPKPSKPAHDPEGCEPYLTACDTQAPLFWYSEPSTTFAHTPLPNSSTARLSPNRWFQVNFILALLGLRLSGTSCDDHPSRPDSV